MATKGEIKGAAFHLFAYKGYEATTTNDIASAVGLKKQSLYSHYDSKSALYAEILKECSDVIHAELNSRMRLVKDRPTEDLIKSVFECITEIFSERERLLLWKRAYIDYCSGEGHEIDIHADWNFDRKLKEALYNEISKRHEHIGDSDSFNQFFLSFMTFVHGYLDFMLLKKPEESRRRRVWKDFWAGTCHYFRA